MHIPILVLGIITWSIGHYTQKRIEKTGHSPFPYMITVEGAPDLEIQANLMIGKLLFIIGFGAIIGGIALPQPFSDWPSAALYDPYIRPLFNALADMVFILCIEIFAFTLGDYYIRWRLAELTTFLPPSSSIPSAEDHPKKITEEPPAITRQEPQVWQHPAVSWGFVIAALLSPLLPLWMWIQVRSAGQTGWIISVPLLFFGSVTSAAIMAGTSLIMTTVIVIGYHYSPRFQSPLFGYSWYLFPLTPMRYRAYLKVVTLYNLLFFPLIALPDYLIWVWGAPDIPSLTIPQQWLIIAGVYIACSIPFIRLYLKEKLA